MELRDKVVVVTGGGNGIGRQVVLELLRRGARVAAVDVRRESLDETIELAAAGDRLAVLAVDVTDRAGTKALPTAVTGVLGAVDVLVEVACIVQPFVPLKDLECDAIDRVVDVNLKGTINMVKAFLPHLLERPVAHIANVSSMGGFLPVPGQTICGASKAAVKLLTEGLYAELLDTDVGVSVIMPGAVATEITAHSGVATPSVGAEDGGYPVTSPQDAASIIADGIEKERLHVHVGRDSQVMNLLSRAAPKQATHVIQRRKRRLVPS